MYSRIFLLLLVIGFTGCAQTPDTANGYSLYLVRHAEKQADQGSDPPLTEAGKQRAKNLAQWMGDKRIKDIWSSDYKRTRETAGPLLDPLGLELLIYDPRDLTSLSDKLFKNQRNALVVGHSNTTPKLARLLCDCEIDDMDESEYDRLIVISVANGETSVRILQQNKLFQH